MVSEKIAQAAIVLSARIEGNGHYTYTCPRGLDWRVTPESLEELGGLLAEDITPGDAIPQCGAPSLPWRAVGPFPSYRNSPSCR